MKLEADTIDEYFDVVGDKGEDLENIDRIIRDTAPELKRQLFAGRASR